MSIINFIVTHYKIMSIINFIVTHYKIMSIINFIRKKRVGAGPLNQPLCGLHLLCVVVVAGFSSLLDSRLEGPGRSSTLAVSLDPVVVASHPLHRRFRHRRWSWSIRLSRRFGVSSSARRPRSRSFNRFAHGRRLVVGHNRSCSISSRHRAAVLKSHHDRPSVPLKGTSRSRTASWSRNIHVVESHIHSISVVVPPFTVVAKSGAELGPLVLILVVLLSVLSVHLCSFVVCWSLH